MYMHVIEASLLSFEPCSTCMCLVQAATILVIDEVLLIIRQILMEWSGIELVRPHPELPAESQLQG
jgi:hypothetical protein